MFKTALVHWYLNEGPWWRPSGASASVLRNKQLRSVFVETLCFLTVPLIYFCSKCSILPSAFETPRCTDPQTTPPFVCPTAIQITMKSVPCFPPFPFVCSMCLIFMGNIIYSEWAPQAQVTRKNTHTLYTQARWMDFEICLALNEWVEKMIGVLQRRCFMTKGGVSLSSRKGRFRESILWLCRSICVCYRPRRDIKAKRKKNAREKPCSYLCVCLCDCERQTHFNLSYCCHQSVLSVMEGGVTKEHAGRMRDREQEGEGITLSSGHWSVYLLQTDKTYVCVCVSFHQLRNTLTAGPCL